MDKVSILLTNVQKEVTVIRYYESDGNNYFIFSEDEVDDTGFVKLYANKINNVGGALTAVNIVDENEWTTVKEMIKVIIKANNEGQKSVRDLNYHTLANIAINDSRVFKLKKELADILALNKEVEEPVVEMPTPVAVEPVIVPEPVLVSEPMQAPVQPVLTQPEMEQPLPVAPTPMPVTPLSPFGNTDALYGGIPQVTEPVAVEQPVPATMEEDYKLLYESEKERVQGLTIELTDLQTKLANIKNIIE